MPPSRRIARVNQLLREEIADVLRTEVKDETLTDSLISITEVDTSPDLRAAKVYFSVYGEDEEIRAAQQHLDRAAGFLRRHLLDRLDLRAVPRLEFVLDTSIARGDRIMRLMRGLEQGQPSAGGPLAPGDGARPDDRASPRDGRDGT